MRTAYAAVAFAVFFLLSTPGFAEPRVKARLSQDKIKPTETTTLSLEAEWLRSEAQYSFAIPNLPLENLTVVQQGQSQETYPGEGGAEWTRKTFTFELKPGKPGPAGLSAFELPYIDPELQKGGTAKVPALKVQVKKSGFPVWIFAAAGAVLFVPPIAVLILLKKKKSEAVKKEPLSPAEEAAERFRELLEQQTDVKTLSFPELNQHLRSFLTQTYRIPGTYNTEGELARGLESASLPNDELKTIKTILSDIEEIKYVGTPTESEYRRLRNDLLRFIHSKKAIN